jgi:hypothetical protein
MSNVAVFERKYRSWFFTISNLNTVRENNCNGPFLIRVLYNSVCAGNAKERHQTSESLSCGIHGVGYLSFDK